MNLMDFAATEYQKKVLKSYLTHNSSERAAAELGIDGGSVRAVIRKVRRRAAQHGFAPEHDLNHPVPEGFKVKGTSTLYGPDGDVRAQWVKTDQDKEAQEEAIKAMLDAYKEEVPRAKPVKPKIGQKWLKQLANQYTITDYHLGMYAWGEETGADWDIAIAEKLLIDWFSKAIELSPNAETAIFAQIGDFLHWDGLEAKTPNSGHLLDADTRIQLLIRLAIRVTRQIIQMLLTKHKHVHVIIAEGNHDEHASKWLVESTADHYRNEPRVTVDTSPKVYYCYTHGNNVLFYHHGHKKNLRKGLDSVFVSLFREEYGRAKHAYAHTGHYHHDIVMETNLMRLEQHRTLAAPDAYAARGGWISERDAKVITYHKEHGEVSRLTISPEMLK